MRFQKKIRKYFSRTWQHNDELLTDEHVDSNRLLTNRIVIVLDSEHLSEFKRPLLTFKIFTI